MGIRKKRKYKFHKKTFIKLITFSFLFASSVILLFNITLNNKITKYINLINMIAIKQNETNNKISYNNIDKKLKTYPSYGTKYANLIIESINLKLPIYYGDNLEILSHGIGQYAGSFFPGEEGTTILAGHSTKEFLARILELKENDIIKIETSYGTFKYIVNSYKVVNEKDLKAFEVKKDKSSLILYTCYPLGYGKKINRYVVYANKGGNDE